MQIPKTSPFRSYANRRVEVHVLLDGAVEIFYKSCDRFLFAFFARSGLEQTCSYLALFFPPERKDER
jgi:hypothetical protein